MADGSVMAKPSEIVGKLGGAEALAARFKITRKAIEQWEARGRIPSKRYVELLSLAKERRVRLSLEDLSTHQRVA